MRLAVVALVLGSLAGCKKTHCLTEKEEYHAGGVRMEWSQCPDEHNHIVDCEQRDTEFRCGCIPGDSFTFKLTHKGDAASGDMTGSIAADGCKWDISP